MADRKLTELTEATEVDLTDQLYAVVGETSNRITVETLRNALIERGSNSNGEYVRFADGTQMCWAGLSSPDGDGPRDWTYPASFTGSVRHVVTGNSTSEPIIGTSRSAVDGGDRSFAVWDKDGNEVGNFIEVMAIGRWF